MANVEQREGEPRKVVTNKERERRLKAARRKKFILRTVFILAGILIIAGLAFLVVTLAKGIKKLSEGAAAANKYYCSAYQLENAVREDLVVNTGETLYIIRNGTLMSANASGSLIWQEDLGEGDYRMIPYDGGVAVYAVRGNRVSCFNEKGLKWERTEDAPIVFAAFSGDAGTCLVCTEPEDCSSRIVYFETKSQSTVSGMLLEKKYTSNHVVTAAISPGGKSIAVAEIADSGETAATRLSVIDVSSGKSFFSKMIENEICPYCSFAGETNIVAAGRRNVYAVEKIDKNNAGSAKFTTLIALGDVGNDIEHVMTFKKHLAVALGSGDGKSEVRLYDFGSGEGRSFTVERNVKGFLTCGEDSFVCYTTGDFIVHDFVGNKLCSCDEKLDIENISGDGKGHFALNGVYGTVLVEVKKAG